MAIRPYPKYESKTNYKIVENTSELVTKLLSDPKATVIAVDTEAYYDPNNKGVSRYIRGNPINQVFCITMYDGKQGYYIKKDFTALNRLFERPDGKFVFHNHKFDRHMLENAGVYIPVSKYEDTMVMIHLIDEEFEARQPGGTKVRSKKLKDLAFHFLGNNAHKLEELVGEYRSIKALHNKANGLLGGKDNVSFKEVEELNIDLMKDYACTDAQFTYELYFKFLPEMDKQNLWKAYDLDMGASDAVFKHERRGIRVDTDYYEKLYYKLGEDIRIRYAELVELTTNDQFSVDNSADIKQAFERLGVVWAWFTTTKEPATDKRVLKQLVKMSNIEVSYLASTILAQREDQKIRDTFVKGMLNMTQHTGRIHPDFNVCPNDYSIGSTRTGRLSSTNINFQNIPRDNKDIRYGIIPTDDYFFVEIDAAQQEYRMLGHYANDKNFKQLIKDGIDVHTGTAMKMLGLDEKTASVKTNRDIGKRLNFALVYGLGLSAFTVALGYPLDEALYNKASYMLIRDNVSYKDQYNFPYLRNKYKGDTAIAYYTDPATRELIDKAKDMKTKYFSQFPDVEFLLNKVKQVAREYGYIRTWGGRKRHFKDPKKESYKAPNALIQGSCGDILKTKIIELEEFLKGKQSRVILTVHDSILFEIHKTEQELVPNIINLLRTLPFRVPMDWDAEESRTTWADMVTYIPYEPIDEADVVKKAKMYVDKVRDNKV